MGPPIEGKNASLEGFAAILADLKGVVEVKVVVNDGVSWLGVRTTRGRAAHVLLEQIERAAVGYGLDVDSIEFGILAD